MERIVHNISRLSSKKDWRCSYRRREKQEKMHTYRSRGARHECGIALLEGAIVLSVFLPLLVLGAALASLIHDQNIIRAVPSETIRRLSSPLLRWHSQADVKGFGLDEHVTQQVLTELLESARSLAGEGIVFLSAPSVKVCIWSIAVDPSSGLASSVSGSRCRGIGAAWNDIQFQSELTSVLTKRLGIKLVTDEYPYLAHTVLIGVKLKSTITRSVLKAFLQEVEFADIQIPRHEVTL